MVSTALHNQALAKSGCCVVQGIGELLSSSATISSSSLQLSDYLKIVMHRLVITACTPTYVHVSIGVRQQNDNTVWL